MRRGDLVLLNFPFASGAGSKVRPALVVQCDVNNRRLLNTIVAMVSTSFRTSGREPTQVLVDPATTEGKSSGLLHPSVVKCENLFTVEQTVVIRTIGHLAPALLAQIESALKASLELG